MSCQLLLLLADDDDDPCPHELQLIFQTPVPIKIAHRNKIVFALLLLCKLNAELWPHTGKNPRRGQSSTCLIHPARLGYSRTMAAAAGGSNGFTL